MASLMTAIAKTLPKPKLLYLVTEDWYFVSHRLPLAVAALKAGFDVVVVTRVDKAEDAIRAAGLRLISIPFNRSKLNPFEALKTLAALRAIYRSEAPDIVHHVAMTPVIYGSIAAAMVGGRRQVNALMGLGYVFISDDLKARLLRAPVAVLLRMALKARHTRVIVQNRDDFKLLEHSGFARSHDLRLIRGSGVDPRHFAEADAVGSGTPTVVLPARMLRDKGVLEFVEAARLLKAKGVLARFVLCGSPDPLNPASLSEDELRRHALAGVVEYWGWQKDMSLVWKAAQVVCLPSYGEGLPKVLLEAAASYLPLVAADVPGCREIVQPGVNGWLVPRGDEQALAAALEEALSNPDLRVQYGRAGRRIIEQEMSLQRVVKETLAVYSELLDEKRTLTIGG
jgi:glycosyltransferase involved in cell wall biosynthesis